MKNLFRSIFLAAAAALLLASAGVPSSEAIAAQQAARPNAFDGEWSVVIYTLQGDCGSALRYSLRIVGGRVQTEDASYQAAGAVNAAGSIRVVVAEGGRQASGAGRLAGNNGSGVWRTSTGQCSGQWRATRRS